MPSADVYDWKFYQINTTKEKKKAHRNLIDKVES